MGMLCLGVLFGSKILLWKWKRIPLVLRIFCYTDKAIVFALATLASYVLNKGLSTPIFAITKEVPAGLPAFHLPGLSLKVLSSLYPSIFFIVLVGLLEHIAITKKMGKFNN